MPDKALGQHWLKDPDYLQAVIDAAGLSPQDTVLEIGPGLGTLTALLLRQSGKVVAIELDPQLVANLKKSFAGAAIELVEQDILDFDLSQLPMGYKVAANIPYYLTAPILQKLAQDKNPPQQIGLLIQKEVAERLSAKPGNLSVLAISIQLHYKVKNQQVVPASAFTPEPRVDSQVVSLTRLDKPLISVDEQNFMRFVKAGYANKRKTLVNSLSNLPQLTKERIQQALNTQGISTTVRAQELSIRQWEELYNYMDNNHG